MKNWEDIFKVTLMKKFIWDIPKVISKHNLHKGLAKPLTSNNISANQVSNRVIQKETVLHAADSSAMKTGYSPKSEFLLRLSTCCCQITEILTHILQYFTYNQYFSYYQLKLQSFIDNLRPHNLNKKCCMPFKETYCSKSKESKDGQGEH